jgi:hypothetical protein
MALGIGSAIFFALAAGVLAHALRIAREAEGPMP